MDPYSGKVPVGIQKVIANGSSLETLRYRVLNFVIIFLFHFVGSGAASKCQLRVLSE